MSITFNRMSYYYDNQINLSYELLIQGLHNQCLLIQQDYQKEILSPNQKEKFSVPGQIPKLPSSVFTSKFEELAVTNESLALIFADAQLMHSTSEETIRIYKFLLNFWLKKKDKSNIRYYYQMVCRHQPELSENWEEFIRWEGELGDYSNAWEIYQTALKKLPEGVKIKKFQKFNPFGLNENGLQSLCKRINNSEISKQLIICISKEFVINGDINLLKQFYEMVIFKSKINYECLIHSEFMMQLINLGELKFASFIYRRIKTTRLFNNWSIHLCIFHLHYLHNLYDNAQFNLEPLVKKSIQFSVKECHSKIYIKACDIEIYHGNFAKAYKFLQKIDVIYKDQAYLRKCLHLELLMENNMSAQSTCSELLKFYNPRRDSFIGTILIAQKEEFLGNIDSAVNIIKTKIEFETHNTNCKKLYTQLFKLYIRNARFKEGLELIQKTVNRFPDLVFFLVRFLNYHDIDSSKVLFDTIENTKCGELLCEGARLCLNPFSTFFDLDRAESYLKKSIEITPQFGDSFLEMIRLRVIKSGSDAKIDDIIFYAALNRSHYGNLWHFCGGNELEPCYYTLLRAKQKIENEMMGYRTLYDLAIMKQKEHLPKDIKKSDFIAALPSFCRILRKGLNKGASKLFRYETILNDFKL